MKICFLTKKIIKHKMKKLNNYLIFALLALGSIFIFTSTQDKTENSKFGTHYVNINQAKFNYFLKSDFRLLDNFPTKSHYINIAKTLDVIPADSLRYTDSIYIKTTKDTINITIYNENYAYCSQNTYKIHEEADSMHLVDFNLNYFMKQDVDDAETFRTKDFLLKIKVDKKKKETKVYFEKRELE